MRSGGWVVLHDIQLGTIGRRMVAAGETHIQELAVPVIAHRLVMEPQARFSGATARGVVEEIVKKIPAPA